MKFDEALQYSVGLQNTAEAMRRDGGAWPEWTLSTHEKLQGITLLRGSRYRLSRERHEAATALSSLLVGPALNPLADRLGGFSVQDELSGTSRKRVSLRI